ncbi:hypothetical protein A6R68_05077 [Neotoma lepida]|uniref:Uncharacterized protein n=1 Tax=Neotoma lepida TaxID=56216 RepID=A0A1A6GKI8_NEOLE|nr:hypothetical protein A6R68_05077 [Neotoma lepida]
MPLNRSAHTPVVPRPLRNSNFAYLPSALLRTLSDTRSQTPKPRKVGNCRATEDNPPSQDILATSEAPFPIPKNSGTHQVS